MKNLEPDCGQADAEGSCIFLATFLALPASKAGSKFSFLTSLKVMVYFNYALSQNGGGSIPKDRKYT